MFVCLRGFIVILIYKFASCEPLGDLPICPQSIDFFPNNLPMHCRMPSKRNAGSEPKRSARAAASFSPPGMPGGPMMGGMGGMAPMGTMPAMPPMPAMGPLPPMPMQPMPMPIIPPNGSQKLPIIVMPFYSPDPAYKSDGSVKETGNSTTRKPEVLDSADSSDVSSNLSSGSSSDDSCESSEDDYRRSGKKSKRKNTKRTSKRRQRHHNHRKVTPFRDIPEVLTPILQYVTKDGYVIFEKKISKDEAERWLSDTEAKKEKNAIEDNQQNTRRNNPRSNHRSNLQAEKASSIKYERDNKGGTKVLVKRRRNMKMKPIINEQKANDMVNYDTNR